ncbi:MAG TPA: glycosyl hydrolase 108 family protein [Gammaproteobacteria bacterium]|jgi:lysozyme family protein|nr:glycosyl hydrolase 108 family protein [Gammaproteobacteria bacterium]
MSSPSIATALKFTLKEEGGFVDNPHDHGGATNHGITQATYDTWRDRHTLPRRSVESIADAEVRGIYDEMYWTPGHCATLSAALAVAHFDWCVNHGCTGAVMTLQQVLGIKADGSFGPLTRGTLAAKDHGELWQSYNDLRRGWYRARVVAHPDQAVFLKGWLARVGRLDSYLAALA